MPKREPKAVKALIAKHEPEPRPAKHRAEDRTPLDDRAKDPKLRSRLR